jgi:hypothetical protein
MKKYNIQLYKMKFDGYEDITYGSYRFKKFKPRYYSKKFKSLSDLARYVVENRLFWSPQYDYIRDQLSCREKHILMQKVWAMLNSVQINEI